MRVIAKHAAIHDDRDSGLLRVQGGFLMDYAVLQPKFFHAQFDTAFNDGGYMFGSAEDLDDVRHFGKLSRSG